MLYLDYNFDLSDNVIIFDNDLKLKSQQNENEWGNLPTSWKDGDLFMLKTNDKGKVFLIRKPD
jgi:hypothetical protein